MHRSFTVLIVAFLMLTASMLAACGDATDPATTADADDNGSDTAADTTTADTDADTDITTLDDAGTSVSLAGTWELTDLSVDGASVSLPPTPLDITIADGSIQGQAGCNSFSGTIDRGDDGSLALRSLIQTEMACDQLEFEVTYTAALVDVNRWEALPDELTFVSENARITYRAVASEPIAAAPLVGTVWLLDSVYGPGEGPERSASSVDRAAAGVEAVFGDGKLTISSDRCTDVVFDVAVTEGNGGGSFAIVGQDAGSECQGSESDSLDRDLALGGVIDTTGYMIDGDRLTLLGEVGELVGFVAQS